jgi:hypothetical protein
MRLEEEQERGDKKTERAEQKRPPFVAQMAPVSAKDIRRIVAKLQEKEDDKQS